MASPGNRLEPPWRGDSRLIPSETRARRESFINQPPGATLAGRLARYTSSSSMKASRQPVNRKRSALLFLSSPKLGQSVADKLDNLGSDRTQ